VKWWILKGCTVIKNEKALQGFLSGGTSKSELWVCLNFNDCKVVNPLTLSPAHRAVFPGLSIVKVETAIG
jgi:hypothetical protein